MHRSHGSVRTSVFQSLFGMFFGALFFICLHQIKSRTYFHCGPRHKTSGQDKAVTECVMINKNIKKNKNTISGTYRNETCIELTCTESMRIVTPLIVIDINVDLSSMVLVQG